MRPFDALAPEREVIALDLPGFGETPVRSKNYICVEGLSFHRYRAVYTSWPKPLVERYLTRQAGSRA